MPKMHYFSNKFQKSPSAGCSPPVSFNLPYWWRKVPWFGWIVDFQADYEEIELQKYIYDVISVTYSPLSHRKSQHNYVEIFFQFAPLPIKLFGYASEGV